MLPRRDKTRSRFHSRLVHGVRGQWSSRAGHVPHPPNVHLRPPAVRVCVSPSHSTRRSILSEPRPSKRAAGRKSSVRAAPTRTIDPLSWSSTHISSIFSGRQWEHFEVSSPTPSGNESMTRCLPAELDLAAFSVRCLARRIPIGVARRTSIQTLRWLLYHALLLARSNLRTFRSSPLTVSYAAAKERKGGPPLIVGKRTSQSSTKKQLKGLYSPLREVGEFLAVVRCRSPYKPCILPLQASHLSATLTSTRT
jgi:hypothetical protein